MTRAASDADYADQLWAMCARDPLFYINTFCYTYDPRKVPSAIPFITWPEFQDGAILQLDRAISIGQDVLIEKSRDMGASWLSLLVCEWRWHFHPMQSFLLVSRKEELVDKSGDPKSLFWKIDFLHKYQPSWLLPTRRRQKLHLHNDENGSTIDGESTTGDVARGDRRTAIFLDEFASVENGHAVNSATADATNCRIFNSTPKGTGNAFYDNRQQPGIEILRLHWTQHPEKSRGLYYDENNKPRSPWYDRECQRRAHPMEIAQELDIDYLGSDYQFFDPIVLEQHKREHVRPPYFTGELDYARDTHQPLGLLARQEGRLQLWVHIDGKGQPPADRVYCLGVDIATGTGASNSVLVVGDRKTGEKVAEWAHPRTRPEELAGYAVALARFFKGADQEGAYMIWEAAGPGRNFGDRVIDLGYRNIHYRQQEQAISKRTSDVPGWYPTKDGKLGLLGDYRRALSSNEYINRSEQALYECLEYVYLPNNSVAHSRSANTIDPSGAKDNHGDRVIADALCWKGIREVPQRSETAASKPPDGCYLDRRQKFRESREKEKAW